MGDTQTMKKCEVELAEVITQWLDSGATDTYSLRTPCDIEAMMARAAMQVLLAAKATQEEADEA